MKLFRVILLISMTGLLLASFIISAQAMSVRPMELEFSAAGKMSGQITVVNDGASMLPVEIVVSSIEVSEAGDLKKTPSDEDFVIIPPQALVPSGGSQVFRVQWVGDTGIKASRSYTVSVNQVPVKMPKGKSGVQLVFNFGCLVNVAPAHGISKLNIVHVGNEKDENGRVRPTITVRNSGNIHAKLTNATIKLSSGDWSETLAPENLRQLVGVGLIQPGKARRFLLPVDLPAGTTSVNVTLEYKHPK